MSKHRQSGFGYGFFKPGGWRLPVIGMVGLAVIGFGIWWTTRQGGGADGEDGGREERVHTSRETERRERKDRSEDDVASRLGRAGEVGLSDVVEMFAKSEVPRLSRRQIDEHLKKTGRNTRSLLAASQLVEGSDLLDEAVRNAPNDPQVLLTLALNGSHAGNRDDVLEAFAAVSPTNSLADYLLAARGFSAGRTQQALEAMQRGTGKPMMNAYQVVSRMDTAAVYHSAGYAPSAARVAASFQESAAWCSTLATLGPHLGRAVAAAQAAGRKEDALDFAFMGMKLSERMRGGGNLVCQVMAGGPERAVLTALPKDAVLQPGGPTAAELLVQCEARAQETKELLGYINRLREMPAAEQEAFFEMSWRSGEAQAARQFRDKQPAAGDGQ